MNIIDFTFLWQSGLYLLLCLCLFFIAKLILRAFWPGLSVDHELVEKDNVAYALLFVGYFVGVLLSMLGVLSGEGGATFWEELGFTAVYALASILILHLSGWVYDTVFLRKVSLRKEIVEEKNLAAGLIKGASLVSSGVILYGVLLVDAEHPQMALLYWGVAQILVLFVTVFYELISPFKMAEEIRKKNLALGISVGGVQIAFAILIQWGIQVEHTNWVNTLLTMGIDVGVGMVLLPLIRLVVDKIFLPSRKLTDEIIYQDTPNVGAGLIEAFSYIGGALLFVWCWNL